MFNDPEIFRNSLEGAKNHLERAEEGRELLKNGKPLSEMKTPITGLNNEQTKKRREDYINWLSDLNDDKLRSTYQNTVRQLQRRLEEPNKGSSELELQRILLEDEFNSRNIEIPKSKI